MQVASSSALFVILLATDVDYALVSSAVGPGSSPWASRQAPEIKKPPRVCILFAKHATGTAKTA
ncbi:hypothetical protein HMPREF9374_0514 [Desmospora sp. 8437]|nr:hypothetical protein HMPREF9374_0514 [Desmospora sp. 8437]